MITKLPNGWSTQKIGEIASIASGGTPDRKNPKFWNGNIPWVTTSLIDFNVIVGAEEFITTEGLENSAAKLFNPNTLLMALYGQGATRGKTAILGIKAATNQACAAIQVLETIANYKFVFHWLVSQYSTIRNQSNSGSQENLSGEILKSIYIDLPPLPEQNAIAFKIDTVDNVLRKLLALIVQKELRMKGLMQQLLTGKKRLKGFSEDWKPTKLNTLFERVTRKNDKGCSLVVTISGKLGFVVQTEYFKKAIASETLDNYFLLRKGEFGYNKSYSNGYPWGAVKRLSIADKAVVTSLYICFRIRDESKVVGSFMEKVFESGRLNRGLMRIAHEGGRAHGLLNVTPEDFFGLTISTPEKDEQLAISRVLETAAMEIDLLKAKADKLREQKKGLMQVLLTGKKRFKEFLD